MELAAFRGKVKKSSYLLFDVIEESIPGKYIIECFPLSHISQYFILERIRGLRWPSVMYMGEVESIPVKVLILPKFEIGDIEGDFPGEAQLFDKHYCARCEKIDIPNTTPSAKFYFNSENGVGLLLTSSGKAAAGLSLMSLLSFDAL